MTISKQIRRYLDEWNLTVYGASQIIGAETDGSLKAIHKRLSSYLSDTPPESIRQLEETLAALGLKISITKITR